MKRERIVNIRENNNKDKRETAIALFVYLFKHNEEKSTTIGEQQTMDNKRRERKHVEERHIINA